MRNLGKFLIGASFIALVMEFLSFKVPTISWAFNLSRDVSYLGSKTTDGVVPWFGYLVAVLGIAVGVYLHFTVPKGKEMLPVTQRRIQRFKESRRGYVSLLIILFFVFLASLGPALVGKRALYVNVEGVRYFPAFEQSVVLGKALGIEGEGAQSEVDYRLLKKRIDAGEVEGSIWMPLIPFDPTQDSVPVPTVALEVKDGVLLDVDGEPLNGRVSTLYDQDASFPHITYEYRRGKKQHRAIGKNRKNEKVYEAKYADGVLVEGSEAYWGEDLSKEDFLGQSDGVLRKILYHAAPPMWSSGHVLGTNTSGNDLLAYLYGGLQVNIRATLVFIPFVYFIGVSIGLIMGYFGGAFDLIVQRIIEIFSTIPFLFVVIIISSIIPQEHRGLGMILAILIAFGWMGMTYLMRTAALKEKARDYVAAARVSGASTPRILFSHILPNTVAILVTLVPFSISSIIMSLTALDYLGFGLPPDYATWGSLLKAGLANFSKPWLIASAFTALVSTLVLITFVGEAVRDAFDPKKFSTYK